MPRPGRKQGPGVGASSEAEIPEVSDPVEIARKTAALATQVEAQVFERGQRADRMVADALRGLAWADRSQVRRAIQALFRWRGWVALLHLPSPEARLLTSVLLQEREVPEVCRVWARRCGVDPTRLFGLGDAPDWPAKANGLRRLFQNSRLPTDPWLLFPGWIKDALVLPPGDEAPKHRYVKFLYELQKPPAQWVRVRSGDHEKVWKQLRDLGLSPWLLRGHPESGRLPDDVDLGTVPAAVRAGLELEDLTAQAVVHACDPEPGERWWVLGAGAGEKALHLADRMKGRGTVVATDVKEKVNRVAVDRFRRAGLGNLAARSWDQKRPPGKLGSFQGVLVEPLSTGIGTWRRNPEARWMLDAKASERMQAEQSQLLRIAATAVRPGGSLVYSVKTVTGAETEEVVRRFLEEHPGFAVDPFPVFPENRQIAADGFWYLWPAPHDQEPAFVARFHRSQ